jgi:hypothetical protein
MFVKKISINRNNLSGNTFTVPITIPQKNDLGGQSDIIDSEFISVEREKNINDIIDYEKVRFLPSLNSGSIVNTIVFNLYFIPDISYNTNSSYEGKGAQPPSTVHTISQWGGIGFTQEDIRYRRNKFKKSFLRLSFYDTDEILGQQGPIFIMTLYPQIFGKEPLITDQIQFKRQSPIVIPNGFAEGYYLYFYKDLVNLKETYNLYMKAEFLNAYDGKIRKFMMNSTILNYGNDFVKQTQLKYKLTKTNDNYLYSIDDSNKNVIEDITNKKITINLYETVTN